MNGIRRANSIRVGQRLRGADPRGRSRRGARGRRDETYRSRRSPHRRKSKAKPEEPVEVARSRAAKKPAPDAFTTRRADIGARSRRESPTAETSAETLSYTVRRGDNLTRIAHAHDTTVAEIAALNRLGNRASACGRVSA